MPEAAIALGSNLGSKWGRREQNLFEAIGRIAELGTVQAVSRFYDTAPVGFLDQPRFLNGALLLVTSLAPVPLLRGLLGIELAMGRDRASVAPKGPRVIDLDLIFYDHLSMESGELTLPHPSMQERAFVLAPLAEIAPDWLHPTLGKTTTELLRSLPACDVAAVSR